jgi:hypothetical protein
MILFACYRKDEAHDAELYCAAVASTLACYDRAVVDHVTDPRSGMASEMKFLPAVAEVRTFCNEAAARMKLHAKRERLVVVPFVPPPIKPGQVDYAGFLKLAEDGKTKGRPVGPFETAEDEWNRNVAFGIAKERDDKQGFIDANQRWLNRECAEEGVNSSFETVSPSLRALLAKQDAERLDV